MRVVTRISAALVASVAALVLGMGTPLLTYDAAHGSIYAAGAVAANDDTRAVPKKPKDQKQKDPPTLPPSVIPGAKNPGGGGSGGNGGGGANGGNNKGGSDDHCKGSPNCSKTFDRGEK